MKDRRIEAIEKLIDSGKYKLLSLDIFDTVVYRTVPRPKDLFFLVGREFLKQGLIWDSSTPESFTRERMTAENRARLKKPSLEVNLEEIYAEFPKGYVRGGDPQSLMKVELAFEQASVRLNPDMKALIERTKGKGLATAFVSDTYFTQEQLQDLVGVEVDHWIVSSKEQLSKYQGLHRVLLERCGHEPSEILHVGNSLEADIEGPKVFEIDRYWFREWPEAYEDLLSLELPNPLNEQARLLAGSDHGLTFVRTRAMSAVEEPYAKWGAGVLGPVMAGFGQWVVDKCKQNDISLNLCLMREGDILKSVMDSFADSGIQNEKFYISRYAARKASIFTGTEQEIGDFLVRPTPQPCSRLLEQVGLKGTKVKGFDPDKELDRGEVWELVKAIRSQKDLKKRVIADSRRARKNLMRHLQEVVGDKLSGRIGILDLGYKGTIQDCLQRILDHELGDVVTHGLYLVTGGDVYQTQSTGAVVEGWLAENGQPIAMAHTFMRSPEVVEQSLMARCGSTLGHEADGSPILDAFYLPEAQLNQIDEVQEGILAFCHFWADECRRHPLAEASLEIMPLRGFLQAICIRSVARPVPAEIELFKSWQHDENFGSTNARTLIEVKDMDPWEMDHMSAHQLASLPSSRIYWPFGLATKIHPSLGESVANIFLRTVDPKAFNAPLAEQYVVVYWDSGHGFNSEEAAIRPYTLNNRGRVWQRFSMPMKGKTAGVKQMAFSIGAPSQVVELGGIAVNEIDKDGLETKEKYEPEMIQKLGFRHLSKNLYLAEEDPALFVLPLENELENKDRVEIDLFFGLVGV